MQTRQPDDCLTCAHSEAVGDVLWCLLIDLPARRACGNYMREPVETDTDPEIPARVLSDDEPAERGDD